MQMSPGNFWATLSIPVPAWNADTVEWQQPHWDIRSRSREPQRLWASYLGRTDLPPSDTCLQTFSHGKKKKLLYRYVYYKSCYMKSVSVSCSVMSDSLPPYGLQPARLLCPWDSPGKNIGVGGHSLPQGIFLAQGLNSSLLHCRQILYCLNHQRSPASATDKGKS